MDKMTNCKACNKEIAKGVKKCPHCGKDQRNFFMRHKIITFLFGFFVILTISSALRKDDASSNQLSTNTADTKKTDVKEEKEEKEEIIEISAKDFTQAYEDNEVKADKTYKDKTVQLTGTVTEVGVMLGKTFVVLSSGEEYSFTGAQCFFDEESEIDKVSELKDGDTVTIQGVVDGKSIYVGVNDCVLK